MMTMASLSISSSPSPSSFYPSSSSPSSRFSVSRNFSLSGVSCYRLTTLCNVIDLDFFMDSKQMAGIEGKSKSMLRIFPGTVMNLIGDMKGKVAVMADDMIDTAGTIAKGAALLHEEGAREVYACCTHAVFSPPAIERLSSGLFQEVIIAKTIPFDEKNYFPQLSSFSSKSAW